MSAAEMRESQLKDEDDVVDCARLGAVRSVMAARDVRNFDGEGDMVTVGLWWKVATVVSLKSSLGVPLCSGSNCRRSGRFGFRDTLRFVGSYDLKSASSHSDREWKVIRLLCSQLAGKLSPPKPQCPDQATQGAAWFIGNDDRCISLYRCCFYSLYYISHDTEPQGFCVALSCPIFPVQRSQLDIVLRHDLA